MNDSTSPKHRLDRKAKPKKAIMDEVLNKIPLSISMSDLRLLQAIHNSLIFTQLFS